MTSFPWLTVAWAVPMLGAGVVMLVPAAQRTLAKWLALVVSVVMVTVLNRVWPISHRKLVNDVTGWQLGILGTTYGVILGFMLYTVWNDFHVAEINSNLEATSLLRVTRIAAALPSPEREEFARWG